jgi:superfamily II DNA/RNA helicase
LKLLIGTDAASTGLNLQRLGCLINLDLPWNPTEQVMDDERPASESRNAVERERLRSENRRALVFQA